MKRVHERNRDAESSIPLSYLQQIHDKYESWLMGIEDKSMLEIVDANESKENILERIQQFL